MYFQIIEKSFFLKLIPNKTNQTVSDDEN